MDWYYADDDNRIGPVSDERFHALLESGTISNNTLVWREGMADWKRYVSVAPSRSAAPKPSAEPIQTAEEPVTVSGAFADLEYGAFWIRFVAKIIDGVMIGVAEIAFLICIRPLANSVAQSIDGAEVLVIPMLLLVPAAYAIWFVGRFGATPGKMALGLKVVRADGTSVSYGRAFARYVSEILSGLILLIGYIMAAFDAEKRTLHDHLCDTRVIVSRR